MKRKINSPDIEKKKLQEVEEKMRERELKDEVKESERMLHPTKRKKS